MSRLRQQDQDTGRALKGMEILRWAFEPEDWDSHVKKLRRRLGLRFLVAVLAGTRVAVGLPVLPVRLA